MLLQKKELGSENFAPMVAPEIHSAQERIREQVRGGEPLPRNPESYTNQRKVDIPSNKMLMSALYS